MQNTVKRKAIIFMIIFIFLGSAYASGINIISTINVENSIVKKTQIRTSQIIYIGGNGPNNYSTINEGIAAATNGDTVYVYHGVYFEHLVITKPIQLIGEDRETTIIDGSGNGNVVEIRVPNVIIQGFMIQHGGFYGIYVESAPAATIDFCSSWGNGLYGIFVNNSSLCTISNTKSYHNSRYGMYIVLSRECQIIQCETYENANQNYYQHGIVVLASPDTLIRDCVSYNNYYGIYLDSSPNCHVINCTSYGNAGYGIHLMYKSNNTVVENCTVYSNMGFGFYVEFSSYCKIINCVSRDTYYGIFFYNHASYNEVKNCQVYQNHFYGIYIRGCSQNNTIMNCDSYGNMYGIMIFDRSNNNLVYHNNIFSNAHNGYDDGANRWDNGYPTGGNYWDDYHGKDSDNDGFGDTPYTIDGIGALDHYPLMHHFMLGDMNVDGVVDFSDINPFVLALSNPQVYQNTYHLLTTLHGDINGDGTCDFADINPFVSLLSGN